MTGSPYRESAGPPTTPRATVLDEPEHPTHAPLWPALLIGWLPCAVSSIYSISDSATLDAEATLALLVTIAGVISVSSAVWRRLSRCAR